MLYHFDSPFGSITYDWDGEVCHSIAMDTRSGDCQSDPVSQWLQHYFEGSCRLLPPLAEPTSPFQIKLRVGLLSIPAGEVRTYGELAEELGTSPRALGQALGANPFPILIPCHRVIAVDGLGGFAYGTVLKKQLLNFEKSWPK